MAVSPMLQPEFQLCDSCGKVIEPKTLNFRHVDCPIPPLSDAAQVAIASAHDLSNATAVRRDTH